MKADLLGFLRETGRREAFVEANGELDWKRYPVVPAVSPDPDDGLLIQDARGSAVEIEGYSD